MKITRDKLLNADWNTLFTKDPATFFEAVLVNILWDGPKSIDQDVIERQRYVFLKWHEYFTNNLRHDIETELKNAFGEKLADSYATGVHAGRVTALQNLPFKKNVLGNQTVDIDAVTEMLRQLKAEEPIGVTHNEGQTVTNTNS